MKTQVIQGLFLGIMFLFTIPGSSSAQNVMNNKFEKIVFGCRTRDIQDFENFVKRAKQSGATHINLSNEDLPLARWEYDVENDPYPSWVFTNLGLLKIATPAALKPYLPQDFAESVMSVLQERCKILGKYGLKATFSTFEPQMLPEKVFTDHPLWRGPRVDHPSRSRTARWAPDIDNPEVLQLYAEALAILLKRCPEIEILSFTTNDSGTGLSWSGGLYSGSSGNTFSKYRRTDERIFSFFKMLKDVASKIGGKLEIEFVNTREGFPERIADNLPEGMAIENFEGPDGSPFRAVVGSLLDYYQPFYPVPGIPDPVGFLESLEYAYTGKAKRLFIMIGDSLNKGLYFDVFDRYNAFPEHDILSRLNLLRKIAADNAGEQGADHLLNAWISLNEARNRTNLVNCGGFIFANGGVQQRWLTRPFVPFPGELKPEDRDYYRKFQFQAKTEEAADDMSDLQASQVYQGWSGRFLALQILSDIQASIAEARHSLGLILSPGNTTGQRLDFQTLDLRIQAFGLVCNNAQNAVSYQAQLDKARNLHADPDPRPVIGTPSSWERTLILETARQEIDNTAMLIQLLESTREPLLDMAPSMELEDIRRLGPDLVTQLKLKIRIMNEHWLDYNRIFTTPNL